MKYVLTDAAIAIARMRRDQEAAYKRIDALVAERAAREQQLAGALLGEQPEAGYPDWDSLIQCAAGLRDGSWG